MVIELENVAQNAELFYSVENADFVKYETPITLKASGKIEAYAINNGVKSHVVNSSYKLIKGGSKIQLETEYSNQYSGGGNNALIDYMKGNTNFRTGFWQGYEGKDLIAVVDLGKVKTINRIAVGALQDIKSWIFYPSEIELLGSDNGTSFSKIAVLKNDFPANEYGAFTKEFEFVPTTKVQYRYIKVLAKNYGVIPEWHLGAGGTAWLFLDEITVE